MMKKTIIFLLTALLAIQGLFLIASAEEPTPEGTPIHNAKELAAVSGTASYYLANDIQISGKWESPAEFAGTLDGNGHVILFNGATVTGGLFQNLAGASIRNLKLTEGENENSFKMKVGTDSNYYVGVLANQGYGVLESVYSNVSVGDHSILGTVSAGGFVGAMSGGNLTFRNCVNAGSFKAGKYAGGFVGTVTQATSYTLTLEKCVNYGTVFAGNTVGGLIGHTNGQCLNVTVEGCANFGGISNDTNNQAAGLCGYTKPASNAGCITFRYNINYGTVTNSTAKAQAAGIVARIHANNGGIVIIQGNVNLTSPVLVDGQTGAVANMIAYLNSTKSEESIIDGNYSKTLDGFHTTDDTPEGGNGAQLDSNSINALNTLWQDGFVLVEETIWLKWMRDAGLTDTPAEIPYDVSGSLIPDDPGDKEEQPGATTTDNSNTESEETPTAPAEQNTGDTTAQPEEKTGGCASTVGMSWILLVGIAGIAFCAWRTSSKKAR